MNAYRAVLRTPGVPAVLVLGFLARIPFSTLGLLLTLHSVLTLDRSYLAAGLVVSVSTLGTAISSPWRGRMIDARGLRRAVTPSIIVQSLALILAAFVPFAGVLVLALLGGLFTLPIFSIVRTSLSVLVPAHRRRTAFALDSVITELVFMVGPALVTIAALGIGTRASLVIVGVSVAAAGIGLAIVDPPTRSDQVVLPARVAEPLQSMEDAALARTEGLADKRVAETRTTGAIPVVDPATRTGARRALTTPGGIAVLVGTATTSLLLTAVDVGLVALLREIDATDLLGLVIAFWCVGSVFGGLAYGALTRQVDALWVVCGLGVVTLPIALVHSVPGIAAACFLAGLACAPSITATGEAIAHRVPEEARGEAMGWHGSAMTIGSALGGPLVGAVIDGWGPSWGVGTAGALGVLVAGAGLLTTRFWRARSRARLRERLGDL